MGQKRIKVCLGCREAYETDQPLRQRCWPCARAREIMHNRIQSRVFQAIKRGDLTRRPCEVCGTARVDAHHDDYSRPFDVRWLCRTHHRRLHEVERRALLPQTGT